MKKAIALILTLSVAGGLMIYSASRTLDLLQSTLPPGQKDMAYLALLAFDGGLIAWTLTFMFGATGAWQRGISMLMIVVSLTGVCIGFGADSLLGASGGGVFDRSLLGSDFGLTATIATVAIIALNIAAVTMFHVMSLENQRRMQTESFNDTIEKAAEQKSNQAIPQLAAALATQLTATRMATLEAEYQNRIAADWESAQRYLPAAKAVIDQQPQQATTKPESWIDAAKRRLSQQPASTPPNKAAEFAAAFGIEPQIVTVQKPAEQPPADVPVTTEEAPPKKAAKKNN